MADFGGEPKPPALTPGHPHHGLLMREGSIFNARRLTKTADYISRIKLSRNLTEDHPTQMVTPMEPRVQTAGPKVSAPKHKPTPLEIAYRAQASRIFRAPAYERDARGLTLLERMLPQKMMQLETSFKTSDFQPKNPPSAPSLFGVQRMRDAHQAASRNAGVVGFGVTQSTFPLDSSFQKTNPVAQQNQVTMPEGMELEPSTHMHTTVKRGARTRGVYDDSNYFNSRAQKRTRR